VAFGEAVLFAPSLFHAGASGDGHPDPCYHFNVGVPADNSAFGKRYLHSFEDHEAPGYMPPGLVSQEGTLDMDLLLTTIVPPVEQFHDRMVGWYPECEEWTGQSVVGEDIPFCACTYARFETYMNTLLPGESPSSRDFLKTARKHSQNHTRKRKLGSIAELEPSRTVDDPGQDRPCKHARKRAHKTLLSRGKRVPLRVTPQFAERQGIPEAIVCAIAHAGQIHECFKGLGKKHKEYSSRFENVPSGRAKESAPKACVEVARALVSELPPQDGRLPSLVFPSAHEAYRSLMHHLWYKYKCRVSAKGRIIYTAGAARIIACDDMSSLMDALAHEEWPQSFV
jgi:hypothetical protein